MSTNGLFPDGDCPFFAQAVRQSLCWALWRQILWCRLLCGVAFVTSLTRRKPITLGHSCHSLGQSCARLVVAWADAELALEGTGEVREIVEPDRVRHVFDEGA